MGLAGNGAVQGEAVLIGGEGLGCRVGDLTNIAWVPVWPEGPTIDQERRVSTISEFRSAARESNISIVVAPGTYEGSLEVLGNDVEILMSNEATLRGGVSITRGNQRIRWVGGNINTGSDKFTITGGTTSDLLFDDIYIFGRFEQLGNGSIARLAIINSTIDGDPFRLHDQDFPWYSSPNTGTGRYADWIIANVRSEAESGNAANRFQYMDRLLIVDSAFGMRGGSGAAGLRFGRLSDNVHVEDTLIAERIYASYAPSGGEQQLSNARFEGVTRYTDGNIQTFITHHSDNPPITGVVNNSQTYSDTWGVGGPLPISPLATETGNPPIQPYDGTLPDVSSYGAQR